MRQISKTRKRLAAGAFLIVAGPVALGSVAYACQTLTTLHANPGTAAAGSTVQVFGKNYSANATSSQILIRLDARDGRVIGQFSPRATLDRVAVTIPGDVAPGPHTLLATQSTAAGNAVSGSPGRAALNVTAARTTSEGSAASAAATSSDPIAATPAAATPAAPVAAVTPAADAAVANVTSGSAARTATPAPAPAAALPTAPAAAAEAAAVATDVVPTPAAAAGSAGSAAPDAALVSVGGLLPASSSSNSVLPGLTLGAGLALVLLSLGAFIKSSRNIRSDGPLAG